MTLKELMETYLKSLEDKRSAYSIGVYTQRLTTFEQYCGHHHLKTPSDLTEENCKKYEKELSARKLSANTRYMYIETVQNFLEWLYAENWLFLNLAAGLKRPKWEREPGKEKFSSRLQEKLMGFKEEEPYQSRNRAIFGLLIWEKMKVRDISNLSVMDVDFMNRELRVKRKSEFLKLQEKTIKALQGYIRVRNGFRPKTDYLFVVKGGSRLDMGSMRNVINSVIEKVNK